MLDRLTKYFGEPVMPVSRYCDALRTWARAVGENGYGADHRLPEAIAQVELAVSKSNLLARLIYGGEELRTKKCPVHNGHWSGCIFETPICATPEYPDGCLSGADVTGWLPSKK